MLRLPIAAVIGLMVGALGVIVALTPLGPALEEDIGLAWLFTLRGPIAPPPEPVVVRADGKPAELFELYPDDATWQSCLERVTTQRGDVWPRCVQFRLIRALAKLGASAIVFDVLFGEPRIAEHDAQLAAAMAEAGVVVLFERLAIEDVAGGAIRKETLVSPLPMFRDRARGVAPFPLPKVPSRVNQVWVFKTSVGDVPTLPVVALQVHALGVLDRFLDLFRQAGFDQTEGLPRDSAEIQGVDDLRRLMRGLRRAIGQESAARERLFALLASSRPDGSSARDRALMTALAKTYAGPPSRYINFYGPPHTIRTHHGYEILRAGASPGPTGPMDLTGRVVFVGTSALPYVDQEDGFYTVFTREDGVDLSGVEIAASAFANLLTDRSIASLGNGAAGAVVLAFGLLVGFAAYVLPGLRGAAASLALGGLYFWAVQWLFARDGLWVPLVVPLLVQMPAGLLLGLTWHYLGVKRERERVGRAIRHYVPEKIAESLARNDRLDTSTELVYGTCMATDAENFTTVSETLEPQELADLMNAYFGLLGEPVVRHEGSVTEVLADSMMSVWVADRPTKDQRLHACQAGLEIGRAVERFNAGRGNCSLPTRIGLHAGWVGMGNVGGGGRYAYSLVGDIANTTSRIENLNKHLGTWLLASEEVVQDLDDRLLLRPVGSFLLKGKTSPLPIFEILGLVGGNGRDSPLCRDFAAALEDFEKEDWQRASERFRDLLEAHPGDGPTRFYLDLAQRYVQAPPPAGTGRFIQMWHK